MLGGTTYSGGSAKYNIARRRPCNGAGAKGSGQAVVFIGTTGNRMTSEDTTNKPFSIDKRRVYEAYKAVKSNGGAAGVDRQTIEQFEADLGGKPLQDLEQDELGNLLPTAGARRLHSQKEWRPADFRCAHRKRSDRADGGQTAD